MLWASFLESFLLNFKMFEILFFFFFFSQNSSLRFDSVGPESDPLLELNLSPVRARNSLVSGAWYLLEFDWFPVLLQFHWSPVLLRFHWTLVSSTFSIYQR